MRQVKPIAEWESKAEIANEDSVVGARTYSIRDRWESVVAGWIIFSEPGGGDRIWTAERSNWILFIRWWGIPVSFEKSATESASCKAIVALI